MGAPGCSFCPAGGRDGHRAAPEEYLVQGKHADVRHGRGAVEPPRMPTKQTPFTSLKRPDLEFP